MQKRIPGEFIVVWYSSHSDAEHESAFATLREAERFSDRMPDSAVYRVELDASGAPVLAFVY